MSSSQHRTFSRRGFLKLLLVSGIGAAVLVGVGRVFFFDSLRSFYLKLISPKLPNSSTRVLNTETLDRLTAVSQAITGVTELNLYRAMFALRSEYRRGYGEVCERFAATIEETARRKHGTAFTACSTINQKEILRPIFENSEISNALGGAVAGMLHKDALLFRRFIVFEILKLYSRTDAWIALGYKKYPGVPRGLEEYTKQIGAS